MKLATLTVINNPTISKIESFETCATRYYIFSICVIWSLMKLTAVLSKKMFHLLMENSEFLNNKNFTYLFYCWDCKDRSCWCS